MCVSRRLRPITCLVFACLAGCGGASPEDAYREYLRALAEADYTQAFAMLSDDSRKSLERLRASAEAASAPTLIEPDDLRARIRGVESTEAAFRALITGGIPGATPPLTPDRAANLRITPLENSADLAVLEVETALGPRRVELRRENSRWKVVLTGL